MPDTFNKVMVSFFNFENLNMLVTRFQFPVFAPPSSHLDFPTNKGHKKFPHSHYQEVTSKITKYKYIIYSTDILTSKLLLLLNKITR